MVRLVSFIVLTLELCGAVRYDRGSGGGCCCEGRVLGSSLLSVASDVYLFDVCKRCVAIVMLTERCVGTMSVLSNSIKKKQCQERTFRQQTIPDTPKTYPHQFPLPHQQAPLKHPQARHHTTSTTSTTPTTSPTANTTQWPHNAPSSPHPPKFASSSTHKSRQKAFYYTPTPKTMWDFFCLASRSATRWCTRWCMVR
ncbi:hypothetical protein CC86DRAFT_51073 [Ophiobolus disseminans]|uniref:Uncharacterized protein n=1 Tax=Ophiobolus disseminans TaxID=1469910 RepID=A0A6A6ZSU3_9PLEO|nr:hypothetical protein CC86DRAFT_51073 [Ophiobolus disseminans]